jgi:hypothetical protein
VTTSNNTSGHDLSAHIRSIHPTRVAVLSILADSEDGMSPVQMVRSGLIPNDPSLNTVSWHVRLLLAHELIAPVWTRQRRGARETGYVITDKGRLSRDALPESLRAVALEVAEWIEDAGWSSYTPAQTRALASRLRQAIP